ncbi:MAG: alpha/beta fold hydrolase [Candidatus Methanofastidiosia archaeon]|jgi:dipeptidyl aminopeptidase/acylaminoacyl peptidase
MLVWLHGGPADVCLNNFDPVIQYFALNQYAVFAPNFRGSTGYGKEFEKLNWNDLGGGDLQDVIQCISYLEKKGYGPFVVGGQSYGAYLSLMVLTQYPGVCDGGFCISGMYTLLPEYGSDWLIDSGCVWMDLNDKELLIERSPAFNIGNLETPVFFIHGGKDQYTPLSGLQHTLKKAKNAGVDNLVKVAIYKDEGHGISNQENIEEVYPNIVKFLNKITKES